MKWLLGVYAITFPLRFTWTFTKVVFCTDIVSFPLSEERLPNRTTAWLTRAVTVQGWCKVLPPLNRLTSSLSAVICLISSPPISLLQRASPSHNHLLWKPTRLQSDDTERGAPANGRNRIRDIKSIGGVFGTCTEPIHRARLCKRRRFASRASCSVRIKTRTVKKPFSLGSGREVAELAPRCLLVFSPDVGDLGVEEGGRSLIYGEDITHTHETVKRHARSQPWDHEKDILVATPLFN